MAYCTDEDLQKVRPNILELGVDTWADQIAEAERVINRIIETRWYRRAAADIRLAPISVTGINWQEIPFDPTKLHDINRPASPAPEEVWVPETQLKRLAVYKSLELAYEFLAVESQEPGGFERQRDHFAKRYAKELEEILATGLDYDWSGDANVALDETRLAPPRRLARC